MSLTTPKTFTLDELAKIALGAPELTNEHLSVLQSLLIILLQKLNCHNETVRIQGFPAKCIQKLLNETTSEVKYDFQMTTIKSYEEKWKLLEKLENKTQEIDDKIEGHFEEIRKYHKTNVFDPIYWDLYAAPNEDLCTLYTKHNKERCLMVGNSVFNVGLRNRVSIFLVERVKEYETKIDSMVDKLKEIKQLVNKAAGKQKCIEYMVNDIEDIRSCLNKNEQVFREAMLETQEMLNCKLDRVTLPAMKKYLEQRYAEINEFLKELQKESRKCHILKPMLMEDKNSCLSCGRHRKLVLGKQVQSMKTSDETGDKCFCFNLQREPTILEKMDRLKANNYMVSAPSALRVSRQSTFKKNQLKLDSHGILSNYTSSSFFLKPDAYIVSAMKNPQKKQQLEKSAVEAEKSQSVVTIDPLYAERLLTLGELA
ncbi:hypothetical protein FF38_04712 [Lucilia cuprina]|uniref:Uncharacterized protein n=1 Tax=Lucilia cuprina TaxID=7375 RepID=A0A0L0CLE8_LUCCU|nr:hypothetical protein FF38_04712 [Lucilia cuprina]